MEFSILTIVNVSGVRLIVIPDGEFECKLMEALKDAGFIIPTHEVTLMSRA